MTSSRAALQPPPGKLATRNLATRNLATRNLATRNLAKAVAQRHGQGVESSQRERGPADRGAGELEPRETVEKGPESDLAFQPSERSSQTVVDASAEGDVLTSVSTDLEAIGFGKGRRVAIGGTEAENDLLPCGDSVASEIEICCRDAPRDLHGTIEAQQLVYRVRIEIGRLLQELELLGKLQQRHHAVGDQVDGGLVAGNEQEEHQVDHLGRRDPLAFGFRAEEGGQQVVIWQASRRSSIRPCR